MNLLQLRASETCDFQDPEVAAVFDISRSIYGDSKGLTIENNLNERYTFWRKDTFSQK